MHVYLEIYKYLAFSLLMQKTNSPNRTHKIEQKGQTVMNIAAYCRVSTDKEDQLNSLETQKEFFTEYTNRTGDNLIRLYADEGISGTKIKNRKEFQRMLADAEKGLFDMVVVKDISRFARNTVDLLQSVRKLKSLGIEVSYRKYDQYGQQRVCSHHFRCIGSGRKC